MVSLSDGIILYRWLRRANRFLALEDENKAIKAYEQAYEMAVKFEPSKVAEVERGMKSAFDWDEDDESFDPLHCPL